MPGHATRQHSLSMGPDNRESCSRKRRIWIASWSPHDIIVIFMILPVIYVGHAFASAEGDAQKHGDNAMNCDQKLMEDIFVCVSRYDVSVTDFLLAVGGINNSHQYPTHQNDPGSNANLNNSDSNSNVMNNKNINLQSVNGTTSENKTSNGDGVDTSDRPNTTFNGTYSDDSLNVLKAGMKEDLCRHQQQVMECSFHAAKSLIENPACAPSSTSQSVSSDLLVNDQRYRIKSLMEAILGQYDNFCAHDCRNNLITDMRTCYEEFDLDANLFMSRESHGAVIGSSAYDAQVFCQNREALVKCLRTKTDQCPESDLVLSAVGLDLELMEKGFGILCQNQYTYLKSLECFESHTPEVGICHSLKHRRIITIASLATLHHWTNDKYMREACRIRLEHIRCDLDAWANKEDDTCDEHILDLKRRLHCSLIPPPCLETHRKRTDAICSPHSSSSSDDPQHTKRSRTLLSIVILFQLIQLLHCQLVIRL